MIHFQKMRSRRLSFLKNFMNFTLSYGINLQSLNMKFQEKIFTTIKVIQLWNFGNFGIPEIIPKSLVTLRFSKISLHELKISCKTFQMRHWPNFYFDPAYSNTWLTCNATRFKTNAHDCKVLIVKIVLVFNVLILLQKTWILEKNFLHFT